MRKITTLEELMETIENTYRHCGLRGASNADLENLERGYLDCSYDWVDNSCTGEQLNGTCAIGVNEWLSEAEVAERYNRAMEMYAATFGTNAVLLIADDTQEYGEDENEVILGSNGYGADVIAIVEL